MSFYNNIALGTALIQQLGFVIKRWWNRYHRGKMIRSCNKWKQLELDLERVEKDFFCES